MPLLLQEGSTIVTHLFLPGDKRGNSYIVITSRPWNAFRNVEHAVSPPVLVTLGLYSKEAL